MFLSLPSHPVTFSKFGFPSLAATFNSSAATSKSCLPWSFGTERQQAGELTTLGAREITVCKSALFQLGQQPPMLKGSGGASAVFYACPSAGRQAPTGQTVCKFSGHVSCHSSRFFILTINFDCSFPAPWWKSFVRRSVPCGRGVRLHSARSRCSMSFGKSCQILGKSSEKRGE